MSAAVLLLLLAVPALAQEPQNPAPPPPPEPEVRAQTPASEPEESAATRTAAEKPADGEAAEKAATAEVETDRGFLLVVHPSNPVRELTREEVERIFLKRTIRWEDWDGEPRIDPVDQLPDSEVREVFTEVVHRKPVRLVVGHWQRMIFSGRDRQPEELTGSEEVLEYVGSNERAIGYIDSSTVPGSRVRVLKIEE
ncbi:MAG: hypothetical protein SX243_14930 [Acidobacteriota bacterium]|nr:hypothetical protein [Acidobacteriota bacterium]